MSWQKRPSHSVDGHDILNISSISLLDCKSRCMDTPGCRSVDYFPLTSLCNLNDVAFGDQGIYSLFPSDGDYYSFCGKFFYSDVKWPPRHLNSHALRLFVQKFMQVDIKSNIALHHWPFLKRIHRWPVVTHNKGSVMRNVFPFHYVIILMHQSQRPLGRSYQRHMWSKGNRLIIGLVTDVLWSHSMSTWILHLSLKD